MLVNVIVHYIKAKNRRKNNMRLTKKQAIQKSIEMWKWISEQPNGTGKTCYIIDNNGPWSLCNFCYLCEYAMHHKSCPVFKNDKPIKSIFFPCCDEQCISNNAYSNWVRDKTSKNAKRIYLALLKFYESKYGKYNDK